MIPRAPVRAFSEVMEQKLAENDWKGGRDNWQAKPPGALLARLKDEVRELESELRGEARPREIGRECADVANFAMMIADCCGGLHTPEPMELNAEGRARVVERVIYRMPELTGGALVELLAFVQQLPRRALDSEAIRKWQEQAQA